MMNSSEKSAGKKLGISLVSNMIAMVISLGVSFLLTPFLISKLGKEAYSFFPLANNFIGYMNIISIALNSMASRFITISLASGDEEKSKGYFSTVYYSNIILCGILLIPMAVIVVFIEQFLDIPVELVAEVRILFILMFTSMIIQLMFSVFGVATFAKERMDLYAYENIGFNVLRAGLYVILFSILPTSIVILGLVAVVVAIYKGVVHVFFTRRLLPNYSIRRDRFNKHYVGELISSGAWNSLNSIGSNLLQTMMLLMANILISVSASGDLSIVQTLPNLMTTIISTIYGVLLPRVANVYAKGDKQKTIETVQNSQKILGAVSTVPVIVIILMGKYFFQLWVPGENAEYLQALSIATVLPLLIHSAMWVVYGLNVMNNKVKVPALTFLVVGVLNILTTNIIVRVTNFGLIAIPVISAFFNICYYTFFIPSYAAKEMGVHQKTFYPHIIKTIGFCLISCIALYPIAQQLRIHSWVSFFLWVCVFGILLEFGYLLLIFSKQEKIAMSKKVKEKINLATKKTKM